MTKYPFVLACTAVLAMIACRSIAADPAGGRELVRIREAIDVIQREYIEPVDDARLAFDCRERVVTAFTKAAPAPAKPLQGKPAHEAIAKSLLEIRQQHAAAAQGRDLADLCIAGMMAGLERWAGEPRSRFINREEFADMSGAGPMAGTGLELRVDDGLVKIVSVLEGTPADKAELRAGDVIEAIDGARVHGLTLRDVVRRLRGDRGSTVTITAARPGTRKPIEVTLTRALISLRGVRGKLVAPGYAYLRVRFQQGTVEQLASVLQTLQRESGGVKGVIVDLRDNTGGLLPAAIGVASAFLPAGALVLATKGRGKDSSQRLHADPSNYSRRGAPDPFGELPAGVRSVPLVVLVNGVTAGASEIVAAALQDHKRALVVGSRTYGLGYLHTVYPQVENTALYLITATYMRPNDQPLSKAVTPDLVSDEGPLPRFDSIDAASLARPFKLLESARR